MPAPPVIELREVEVAFGDRKVLDGFSLRVEAGDKLSLVGESSSGKSTLLKVMVGLLKPDRGQVKLFGENVADLSEAELRRLRQRLGMQFQSGALFDSMTVLENLMLARRESARDAASRQAADDESRPMKLLAAVGLSKAAGRKPFQLSGGMRKRAALARAIVTDPELAIFDEPTAGLDPVTSRRIIDLIRAVSGQSGAAMIMAATDVQVARHFSPRLVILHQGRLKAQGSIDELQAGPDPFVKKLLSRLIELPGLERPAMS